ncbi:MAG: amino acid permease [archaeon]|jgi:APA family basic amino acid/polyamine antiporter
MQLERSVSTTQAILYGVGVIVGAGIYTLIGVGAGIAGNALWISFIIAAIVAYLTALSYSELSSKFSKEGAETLYVNKAFNNQKLAFFIGFLSIITWVVSSATVAFGFASYAKLFIPFTPTLIAIGAIILFSIINFLGIQKGVKINNILTIVTISGLLLIIIFGLRFVGQVNLFLGFDGTNLLENSFSLIPSLFSAAALVFFAYLGFEGLANIGEETKEPKKTIPLAIIVSLSIATLLYVAVAIISVSVVSPIELLSAATANSLTQGPLALVAEKAIDPSFGFWLSLIALCATGSTLIVLLNVSSRIIYGLSEQHFFPKVFGLINPKTKTPFVAVIVATVLSIICALVGNLVLLGNMATMSTFLLFFAVNSSLIAIKQKEKSLNDYDNPFSLKRLSFPALLGALFCLFMFLTQFWFQ